MEKSLSDGAVLFLVGWFVVVLAQAVRDRTQADAHFPEPPRQPLRLESASPRELRRLPGIGEVRALELARERWRRRGLGESLDLASLPGIGATTAERVALALASEASAIEGEAAALASESAGANP